MTAKFKATLYTLHTFFLWVIMSLIIGALCGIAGGAFSMAVEKATHLRQQTPWLPFCMPVAGLLIWALYKALRLPLTIGTDEVIRTLRTQEGVPFLMAPAIFLSTAMTHLTGGSAGREGAALQLGGAIGAATARLLPAKADNMRICQLCGMAALFSALFGTPLAATVFVLEIVEIGRFNHRAMVPCLLAALTAKLTATTLGAPAEAFPLAAHLVTVTSMTLIQAAGIGLCCGVVAILFCTVMHKAAPLLRKAVPNDLLRIVLGGALVPLLGLALGTADYQGSGMGVILDALKGHAAPEAFLLKILFTALTLGVGFKGGEIVPSFFIGATLGCTVAPLLGLDPALGAALGIIGTFCGVTNGALASVFLSIELFGTEYLPLFAVAAGISYALSGHISLYHTQTFAEPKMGLVRA